MLKKATDVPENITAAINAILSPYGVSIESIKNQTNTQPESPRYLSIDAAEAYSCLSRWTICRAVKAGKLPQIKLSSAKQGKVLLDRADLDRWLKGLKTKTATGRA